MEALKNFTNLELISLLRTDNHHAFSALYERFWKKLLYFAAQRTTSFADAENIVQDVFVSLWERRASLQLTSTLENYLYVSVKYRIIKLLDSQRVRRRHAETMAENGDLFDDSTQEYLNFEELRQRLEEFIGTLPEQSRLIYLMRNEENQSHHEIAEKLGLSEKAVNARLVRIKKQLRAGLDTFLTGFLL